jgi:hypothetical protein
MTAKKKTTVDAEVALAERLITNIGDLYPVLDEIAGNSNYLKDIALQLERIADAIAKQDSDLKTK